MTPESPQDRAKYVAGHAAVAQYVRDGMRLGLGSGTTSHWFVRALGESVRDGLDVVGVPTSTSTKELAEQVGVPLADLNDVDGLDLAVDGADEIDHDGAMIKGGGASLLWERIVASAAERVVAIVDIGKVVDTLGAYPLPVEVIRFGWRATERAIRRLLDDTGYPERAITLRTKDGEPLVTDSGNHILDLHLAAITDKAELDSLNWIPGVVEHGLFTGVADHAIVGHPDGSTETMTFSRWGRAAPSGGAAGRSSRLTRRESRP